MLCEPEKMNCLRYNLEIPTYIFGTLKPTKINQKLLQH